MYGAGDGGVGILRNAQDDGEEDNATGEDAGETRASRKDTGTEIQSRGHQRNEEDEQHSDGGGRGGAGGRQR